MLITTGFQPLFQGTFTQEEIEKGYAPARRDWPEVITDPAQFAKLLRQRKLVSYGGFGVVYEVDGAAIKIGCIAEDEAQVQQWAYETYESALPVWAYSHDVELPKAVTSEVCPHHGYLANRWDRDSVECHCGDRLGVLVMPLGQDAYPEHSQDEGVELGERISQALEEKFGVGFDERLCNHLSFCGRLMLCDFGDPQGVEAGYW